MKKSDFRSFLAVFVVGLSLGSYVFLNTISVEKPVKEANKLEYNLDEDHYESEKASLPDATLIIKLVEKAKDLIPAT